MKLVKTTRLTFTEGSTERVYEIDLCEVGSGQFVVNFRYGKRGATLKDGSKTALPVNSAEANRVFDKLLQQQTEKGYAPEGAARTAPVRPAAAAPSPAASAARPRAAAAAGSPDRQRARVLELLTAAAAARVRPRGAPRLERLIWRAGELRIREAEPILLGLIGSANAHSPAHDGGEGMRDYCIAWALGRLGSDASTEALGRFFANTSAPPHVRRIATLALQSLSDEETRAEFGGHLASSLPASLQGLARGSDPVAFSAALDEYLVASKPEAWSVIELLYGMDSPTVRPAVLSQLEKVAFTPPFWATVRHIFKAAEYRRDARVFGLIAWRIEKTRANFSGHNWSQRSNRPAAPMAYGGHTRRYLRRRVWRTMRRAGEIGDLDYVKLAVGVLLQFTDADAAGGVTGDNAWLRYWAFNWILHANNPAFSASPNGTMFRLQRRSRGAPPDREEAFPKLWEARPAGLIHLLMEGACTPVIDFAAKAIRDVPAFLQQLDDDDVIGLLGRPYSIVARLGFELAEQRYNRTTPNMPLLVGMATSAYRPARDRAFEWLDEQRTRLVAETGLLAVLVLAPHADAREYAHRVLRASPIASASVLIARVIALMLGLSPSAEDDARARDATRTIIATLAVHLGGIGQEVVRDLLAHPLSGVQELGAELLLRAGAASGSISDESMVAILHSQHPNVRAVGMRLLAEMPDAILARMELLLVRLSTDKNADLRGASRPLVARIARAHPMAAETIARALVEALLRRKLPEEAPSHVLAILREDLFDVIDTLDTFDVWRLLQSASPHAQELGGLLLQRMDPARLEVDQIVKLASHDILSVRQAAWSYYDRAIDRVRAKMAEASRILDAKWEDSRAFAFTFFRERLGPECFTADVLVTILDSVREDVQAFGRELTTKYFREEDGPTLMTKLAEHPSVAVQLYTTNYLTRYATDAPGRLEGLVPYFTTVLSRVNRGRVAKQRTLAFLQTEGSKNEEAAKVVISVLHRISGSMAIELRAAAIAAMLAIHHAQPNVPVPLRIKSPPLRTKSTRASA